MTDETGDGMRAVLIDDHWQAEMVNCRWCRFYQHGEGTCIRRAPDPTFDRLHVLVEEILLLYGRRITDFSGKAFWPSVDLDDSCGDFERGSGLGHMTLGEQRAEWPDDLPPPPTPKEKA